MLELRKIAVTGGLSAGKTTVCQLFKELGAYVVSADEIVHQLLSPGTPTAQQVVNLLGSAVLTEKKLDRKKIAGIVFSQREHLAALEAILYPAVFDEIERRYQHVIQEKKHVLFVVEIPLLYEAEAEGLFDTIISVVAERSLCQSRFEKKGSTALEFDKRMLRQILPEDKAKRAHYTIENNGTFEQLKSNVKVLFSKLIKESDFQ